MRRLRKYLQHRLNPLHMYCRLRDVGASGRMARRVCFVYERFVYRAILR